MTSEFDIGVDVIPCVSEFFKVLLNSFYETLKFYFKTTVLALKRFVALHPPEIFLDHCLTIWVLAWNRDYLVIGRDFSHWEIVRQKDRNRKVSRRAPFG